jgi:hypothetical protein
LGVGFGATVGGVTVAKSPEGDRHLRFRLTFPQSEIARTKGRIFELVGTYGLLILDRMQQSLRLEDGKDVDLTKRAD